MANTFTTNEAITSVFKRLTIGESLDVTAKLATVVAGTPLLTIKGVAAATLKFKPTARIQSDSYAEALFWEGNVAADTVEFASGLTDFFKSSIKPSEPTQNESDLDILSGIAKAKTIKEFNVLFSKLSQGARDLVKEQLDVLVAKGLSSADAKREVIKEALELIKVFNQAK